MRMSLQIYRLLCSLYPKAYRARYEDQIMATAEDMLSAASSPIVRSTVITKLVFELPGSIIKQQVVAAQHSPAGGIVMQGDKLARLNALLMAPFFVLIALNAYVRTVATWHTVMYIGIVVLPIIALAVGASVSIWVIFLNMDRTASYRRIPVILARNWQIASSALLALFIVGFVFGHDSVHCVTDNPAQAAQHPSQTLRCVEHG